MGESRTYFKCCSLILSYHKVDFQQWNINLIGLKGVISHNIWDTRQWAKRLWNAYSLLSKRLQHEVAAHCTIYLVMPLGEKIKIKRGFETMSSKNVFSRWKCPYLSLRGRLTLINVVLDSLPTYMMSLFSIPMGVTQRLDDIRSNFLWHSNKEKKRILTWSSGNL